MQQEMELNQSEYKPSSTLKSSKDAIQEIQDQQEELMATIRTKQEEVIKSIVLTQALYEQDLRHYNPPPSKEGAYREEFIQSVVNKSGVFVREFREISNPYEREEFIMSLSMKRPAFGKVEKTAIYEEYHQTIQKSEQNAINLKRDPHRKQKLIYELEVKDKMRKIQMNQQKTQAK